MNGPFIHTPFIGRTASANLSLSPAQRRSPMKKLAVVLAICAMSGVAFAQTPPTATETCTAGAKAKNLHGAALNSFMDKCKRDAETACTTDSDTRKLAGAARTSHMTKCVNDKVGS
jgi:hypothetical protein